MATLQTRVDRARTKNYVNSTQYTDTVALEDANVIIHQIEDYITSAIWEGFFWDILSIDTTFVDQNEYTIPVISTGLFNWTSKLESISIQYETDWDFIKATEKNRETLEYDLTWYNTNTSIRYPIYFIADNSVFIYPAPSKVIVWAIKFYWIRSLADVTLATTDANLFWGKIPTKYYYLISDWLKQFIKAWQGKEDEAITARRLFEQEILPWIVEKLWNRKVWISVRGTPDLSKYK